MSVGLETSGGYQTFHDAVERQSDRDRLLDDIDTNHDGVIDKAEMKAWADKTFSEKIKTVSNRTPNSVMGAGTTIVLGSAMVVASTYIPFPLNDDGSPSETQTQMQSAGYAMVASGTSVLIGSGIKWITGGKDKEPELPLPNTHNRNLV